MKNYWKFVILIGVMYLAAVAAFAFYTSQGRSGSGPSAENVVLLNELARSAEELSGSYDVLNEVMSDHPFAVVDVNNQVLYKSGETPDTVTVESAVKNNYPYSPVVRDGKLEGYVILFTDAMSVYDAFRIRTITGLGIFGVVLLAGAVMYGLYIKKSIVEPFRKMERFAGKVAEGNLDEPLMIEKNNMFGAFSESFDIMREELDASRKREIALQVKEKELVASLSHDLKTPVTGIKLTAELLKARLEMEGGQEDMAGKLDNIYNKADEIDSLVTDLFTSTLDDLGEFKVVPDSEPSSVLSELIRKYDDRELVSERPVPGVLILIDKKRMGQVIGNMINNSYKYANTAIDVDYELTDGFLEMKIRDHGPGVPEDELELITNKFYRGREQAASVSEGSGLGLYIGRILMEKMGGELIPSCEDGFCVRLVIPLA